MKNVRALRALTIGCSRFDLVFGTLCATFIISKLARISPSILFKLKLQNVCIPLTQFWIDVPDERRDVLAEGVKISISTHNVSPPPHTHTIDEGSTPLAPTNACTTGH